MRLALVWLCSIGLAACDGPVNSVTGPSSLEIPEPVRLNPLSLRDHKLWGTVRAAGVPTSGAEIAELQTVYGDDCFVPRELTSTTSDAGGSYVLTGVKDSSSALWASWVRATKPGYFTDFRRPRVSEDTRLDFVLDPWVHVPLGDVLRGTVDQGDAVCRGNSYGVPGFCHRYALTVPAAGTLEVTLAWPENRPDVVLDVVGPGGVPCALFSWPGNRRHSLSLPVSAGSTYEIRVVDDGNASPLHYELTTALR